MKLQIILKHCSLLPKIPVLHTNLKRLHISAYNNLHHCSHPSIIIRLRQTTASNNNYSKANNNNIIHSNISYNKTITNKFNTTSINKNNTTSNNRNNNTTTNNNNTTSTTNTYTNNTTTNNTTNNTNTNNNMSTNNNNNNNKWLDRKGFLLDVYGVAYNCGKQYSTIPGSKEAIDLLRKAGVPFRFCSNTSSKTSDRVLLDMEKFDFDVRLDEIFTPVPVAKNLLQQRGLRPFLLVDPEVDEFFSSLDQSEPNCVVLGDAKNRFSYENMNKAFGILTQHPENPLITLGTGKYYQETEGMFLDCGTFAAALEYATGKKALCIGKPSGEYFKAALDSMGLEPSQAVMVGDDIVGDVEGGQKAGMCGVQVRTGKFRPSDEPHAWVRPDGYVDNLLQAVTLYLQKNKPALLE